MATSASGYQRGKNVSQSDRVSSGMVNGAGLWLVIGGSLSILLGAAGIAEDSLFRVNEGYAYSFSLTTWGWISLLIGIALGIAGLGVLAYQPWGPMAGIVTATASLITQFMFIPYYPWWSITVMTFDFLAIYTLVRVSME